MKKLSCDVCGGRLIMKENQRVECEVCGILYSVEALKEKMKDNGTHLKTKETKEDEFMVIVDEFNDDDKYVTVFGDVACGSAKVGDQVEVISIKGDTKKAEICSLYKNSKELDIAYPETKVWMTISTTDKKGIKDLERGTILQKSEDEHRYYFVVEAMGMKTNTTRTVLGTIEDGAAEVGDVVQFKGKKGNIVQATINYMETPDGEIEVATKGMPVLIGLKGITIDAIDCDYIIMK